MAWYPFKNLFKAAETLGDFLSGTSGDTIAQDAATAIYEATPQGQAADLQEQGDQVSQDLADAQEQISALPTIVRGSDGNFYYSTDLDETGTPIPGATAVANFTDILTQAQDLGGDFLSFEDWLTQTGAQYLDPTQAITDYQNALDNYANRDTAQEQTDAIDFAARLLGLTDTNGNGTLEDEYQTYQNQLTQTATYGGQGYSDAQRAILERAINRNAASMQANAQQLVNKIAAQTGGSTSRAMAAADAQINEISDYVIQASAQMALDELDLQMSQMQSAIQMQANVTSVMSGNANAFLDRIDQEYLGLFDAYTQNINNILNANGMTLEQYSTDMQTVASATEAAYEGIMVQLGVEQTAIDSAWQDINFQLNQILATSNLTLEQWQILVDQYGIDLALQQLEASQPGLFDYAIDLLPLAIALI